MKRCNCDLWKVNADTLWEALQSWALDSFINCPWCGYELLDIEPPKETKP